MFGTGTIGFSARRGLSRAAVGAVLALWCLFALASGDARAFCLDLGGDCSPSAAVPLGQCHDEAPDSGARPGCTSCVDILVHEDASAGGSRPDHDLPAPAAAHPCGCAGNAVVATAEVLAASSAPLSESIPSHAAARTAVLRI